MPDPNARRELVFYEPMYLGAEYRLGFEWIGDRLEIDANTTEFVWHLNAAQRTALIEFLTDPPDA